MPVSNSYGSGEGVVVSLREYLDAENERRGRANAALAAKINMTKLNAMLDELKSRKLDDDD